MLYLRVSLFCKTVFVTSGSQFSRGPICRTNIFQGPNLPGPNLPPRGPICRGPICRGPICQKMANWAPKSAGPICRQIGEGPNWPGPNLPGPNLPRTIRKNMEIEKKQILKKRSTEPSKNWQQKNPPK